MAKKRRDLLIDLLILLFVVACMLLILRMLGRNVLLEIRMRDTMGMRSSAFQATLVGQAFGTDLPLGVETGNRVFSAKTWFLAHPGSERGLGLEEMVCRPARSYPDGSF